MSNMPPITKNIIIINVIFFLASLVAPRYGVNLNDWLGLHFFLASDFNPFQLFTYMFMHGSFMHIFFNMFAVWMFGRIMESTWGPKRFLIYYLACGVGAGVIQELAQLADYYMSGLNTYQLVNLGGATVPMDSYLNMMTTVGASGAVYGILLSFGLCYPEDRMFVFPLPIPIKAKYFVIGYAVIELLLGLQSGSDGIAHFAHLGGMLVGFLLILFWSKGSMISPKGYILKLTAFFFKRRSNRMKVKMGNKKTDFEINVKSKKEQEEMDAILTKVRDSGYESLTVEEKKKLFDASKK